ncbi:MAG TPA: D-2-hydroxyacid dehydrogenase [Dehalococcoidia bacterium]|nr:D-2-hydroxyacid dehydrogenase [Dehalococcoidia bacterium]
MHILITTGLTLPSITDAQLAEIQNAAGEDATVTVAASREDVLATAPEIDVILGAIDPELFAAAPNLQWVHAIASGVDFMLFPEFKNSDIVLSGEKGLVGPHLADHAMALLLAHTRRVAEALRDGPKSWSRRVEYRQEEIELEGLTMGIVGFGGTGREIAKRALGFGMQVRAVDREAVPTTPEVPIVHTLGSLDTLLAASDVVAVCMPLTDETRHMFNDDLFGKMKKGAIIVNVTRGEIVDGDALVRALESGHLGGACLDVHHQEPLPPEDPMWDFPNVVMTPHTAGASQKRAGRNIDRFVGNVRRFRRGQPLIGLVDKELGF